MVPLGARRVLIRTQRQIAEMLRSHEQLSHFHRTDNSATLIYSLSKSSAPSAVRFKTHAAQPWRAVGLSMSVSFPREILFSELSPRSMPDDY